MIEYFISTYYFNNAHINKEKEKKYLKELFNNDDNIVNYLTKKSLNINIINLLSGIIALFVSVLSAKIAFQCNNKKSEASQIVVVLFAFFFSGLYLFYYFIWHTILKNKC